jgi:tetratricopeptide (TPR) repeat protein
MTRMSRYALAAAAAIAIVVGAYWNSLDNAFHFDDAHVVENNLYIRSLKNVPRFFTDATTFSSIRSHASYRPLLSATLAVDYWIGGLSPRPYHRTQIALLVALGAMLVAFYRTWLRDAGTNAAAWLALAAATLFCVHTANTETLNFISSRSEELAVMGVVGSFLVWQAWPRARITGLHLVPMFLGALAKIHAVMYGPLLFAAVWLDRPDGTSARDRTRAAIRSTWPALAATIAVYAFVRWLDAPEWTGGGTARLPYAWTQPFVWLHYGRLFILPVGLTADSDWAMLPTWYDTRALVGYAFLAVLAVIWMRTWKRRATMPIAFGIVWFAIALVPTSSVFPFSEIVNEHRVFFPYVGLALAAACAAGLALERYVADPRRRPAVGGAIAALILAAHAAGTWQRNRVWRTEETLWLDVTQKSPLNGRGLMNYGLTRMARGDYETARAYFERAAVITPNYSTLEINLGIVYDAMGMGPIAESHFTRALALSPDAASHYYYARRLASSRRGPEAIGHLREAIVDSPGLLDTRHLLMRLLAAQDRDADLRRAAAETLALDPTDAEASAYARGVSPLRASPKDAMALGLAALGARRFPDAAEWFRAGVLMDPRSADAWNNRGWAQYEIGFNDAARESFQRSLSINPTHERAVNNLALVTSGRN